MSDVKMSFRQMLKRSNVEVSAHKADRVADGAKREFQKIIMNLESKRDVLEEVLEASKDLSTSNSKDTVNRIDSFDAGSWCNKYHQNSMDLMLVNKELQIASENYDTLFVGSVDLETGEVLEEVDAPKAKK